MTQVLGGGCQARWIFFISNAFVASWWVNDRLNVGGRAITGYERYLAVMWWFVFQI